MAPSEFLRVSHNMNGEMISDPLEFGRLQYTADGHTSIKKESPQHSDSKKHRKRRSRHRNKTNKDNHQGTAKLSEQSHIDNKALQDAIDRDHRRMGFEPMKRNHDHN